MNSGYSGTPLAKKLGIKEGHALCLVNSSDEIEAWLSPLPDAVSITRRVPAGPTIDVIVAFFTREADAVKRLPALERALAPAGGLWLSWPKKASGVATDLTEQTFRDLLLPAGRLVDNKVCAISDIWSGLRFVVRKDRR
ncbi:MAG: DUF3052 domain-containing protein [Acidimicrobiia bacterium]